MAHKQPPGVLELELTNHCQLKCPFCPFPIMVRPKGMMDLDVIDKVASEMGGLAQRAVLHQLGEPLLHPQWHEAVEIVERAGIRASFSTNCVKLNEDNVERLIRGSLSAITLSLDGTADVYETLRLGANFEWVAERVEHFLRARKAARRGPQVVLQIINMVSAEEVKALKTRFGPLLEGIGHIWLKDFATWTGNVVENIGNTPAPEVPLRFRCSKPWKRATIQWNGDVSVCCRDYDGIAIMGNVRERRFMQIWTSQEYEDFRQSLRTHDFQELCAECSQ